MSKKPRKQPKSTREFLDYVERDDVDGCPDCKSYSLPCDCPIPFPDADKESTRKEYQKVKAPANHGYREGHVVNAPNKSMNGKGRIDGTIILIYGGEVHVLDEQYIIHTCTIGDIYPSQK